MSHKPTPERQCARELEETRTYVFKIRIHNSHLGGALTKIVVCKDSSVEVFHLNIIFWQLYAWRLKTPDIYLSFANFACPYSSMPPAFLFHIVSVPLYCPPFYQHKVPKSSLKVQGLVFIRLAPKVKVPDSVFLFKPRKC